MAEQRSPKPQVGGSNPSWPVIIFIKMKNITKNKKIFFTFIFILFFSILITFNHLFKINNYVKIMLITLLALFFLFLIKKNIEKIKYYLAESKSEINKITWPPLKEVRQSTLLVIAIVSLISLLLWMLDSIITFVISSFM